jgi:hypothetical protein
LYGLAEYAVRAKVDGRRDEALHMLPEPLYSAAVCTQCQRASLVPGDESRSCALCGARAVAVPGVQFIEDDLPLFAELERIVHNAKLLKSEAVLIAATLESVSQRWEPPELVLQHVSSRLEGLQGLYNPKQEYSRLLSVVSVLLTIVCTRLVSGASAPKRSSPPSGIRPVVRDGTKIEDGSFRRSKGR